MAKEECEHRNVKRFVDKKHPETVEWICRKCPARFVPTGESTDSIIERVSRDYGVKITQVHNAPQLFTFDDSEGTSEETEDEPSGVVPQDRPKGDRVPEFGEQGTCAVCGKAITAWTYYQWNGVEDDLLDWGWAHVYGFQAKTEAHDAVPEEHDTGE